MIQFYDTLSQSPEIQISKNLPTLSSLFLTNNYDDLIALVKLIDQNLSGGLKVCCREKPTVRTPFKQSLVFKIRSKTQRSA